MSSKTKKGRTNFLTSRKSLNRKNLVRILRSLSLSTPLHPLLFATYPILFLYSINLERVYLSQTLTPFLITLAATIVFWVIINVFIFKNWYKSSIIITTGLIIFFSYGHLFSLV